MRSGAVFGALFAALGLIALLRTGRVGFDHHGVGLVQEGEVLVVEAAVLGQGRGAGILHLCPVELSGLESEEIVGEKVVGGVCYK